MREAILDALKALPTDRAIEDRGSSIWLKCPIHAGGNEKTASFKISLDPPYSGFHYCFGCGIKGNFKRTLQILGLSTSGKLLLDERPIISFSEKEEASLFGKTTSKPTKLQAFREPWPRLQAWRGIPGKLVSDVGGCMIIGGDGREPMLRLPVVVRNKERGYIDCKIRPDKDERFKYINSPGKWTGDSLYPYDFVRSLDPDYVAIVEGPRDALVSIRNGLPALATLGSTSWNAKCVNLILALSVRAIILMPDPDAAGEKLMERVYADLSPYIHVIPIKLPSKIVDGRRVKVVDPGDLSRAKLQKVLKFVGIKLEGEYA
jgi:5S rRNA maturation endonuclease (ribonuclease M5)